MKPQQRKTKSAKKSAKKTTKKAVKNVQEKKAEAARHATAEEMSLRQREISVAEFFTKNRHLLGFDNPRKALLTTIKEGVDNSLDACEEAGILPKVKVVIVRCEEEDRYHVTIEDNGVSVYPPQVCTGSSPRASLFQLPRKPVRTSPPTTTSSKSTQRRMSRESSPMSRWIGPSIAEQRLKSNWRPSIRKAGNPSRSISNRRPLPIRTSHSNS